MLGTCYFKALATASRASSCLTNCASPVTVLEVNFAKIPHSVKLDCAVAELWLVSRSRWEDRLQSSWLRGLAGGLMACCAQQSLSGESGHCFCAEAALLEASETSQKSKYIVDFSKRKSTCYVIAGAGHTEAGGRDPRAHGIDKGLQGRFREPAESNGWATPEPGLCRSTDLVWSAGSSPVNEPSLVLWASASTTHASLRGQITSILPECALSAHADAACHERMRVP